MAYYVDAYLVDLDQLHQVYGSHNTALVEEIVRSFPEDIESANETIGDANADLADAGEPLLPDVVEVLHRSVAGILPTDDRELQPYWLALQLICQYIGTRLPDDAFFSMRPYGLKFIEEEVKAIADLVFRAPPPGPIAFPHGDFMDVGHLTPEQAAQQLAHWKPVVVSTDELDRRWEEQVCEQYRSWLEAAVETKQSIVTFFY